ncbi:MAG TPA: DNA polymerase IV [Gemmatimonadales bacterium]|nr:DNA polymerase IV [Gemmatimonadales bacterium]
MPPRIMHVDLDAFFVEVCRQRHPELRDVDLLVVGGRRESRGVVQSASYGARRFGVRSGMPIAQAARLCPGATFFQGSFAHYREASRAVRAVLGQHSPVVAMASLDEGYLDFTGTEALHPVSLVPVAERVRSEVSAETGLDSSIGIGPNRMIAKLASDYAKPRGICEVRAGWEEGFVAGLELRALPGIGPRTGERLHFGEPQLAEPFPGSLPGIGPRTGERLRQLGLTEVAQVQAMAEADLARLVGDYARELKWRAHGHGTTALHAGRPARSVSRETTLARDATDPEYLDGLLVRFAGLVGADLRASGLVARTVTLKLRHGDFHTVTRRRTLPRPTDLDAELLAPARTLFQGAFAEARRRHQGIRLIGLAATSLTESAPADLFEPADRIRLRELTRAVDKVRERFGFDAVSPARTLSQRGRRDHGPKGEP